MTASDGSLTRKYNTALTFTEMLSRVITSCGGMSSTTTRIDTLRMRASRDGTKMRPGSRVPVYLPRKNTTPRSYCVRTRRLDMTYAATAPTAIPIDCHTMSGSRADEFLFVLVHALL